MTNLEMNILNLYGNKGKQWLANLPSLVKQMETVYGLSSLKPVKNLSYNYVLSGFQGLQPIILKLGLDIKGLAREAYALKAFSGYGVVSLIAEEHGMLLLKRAISGESLKLYFPENDNDAIQIMCSCLKRLHQAPVPKVNSFSHIQDWLMVLDKSYPIRTHYLNKARQLRDNLLSTSAATVLLHGDLHHDNILQNSTNWIVIDPKGVLGEPTFEVAAFIRNPIPELLRLENTLPIINHRIISIAKILDLSASRIREWCFVQSVLAWIWALEDNCAVEDFKQLTYLFDKVNSQ